MVAASAQLPEADHIRSPFLIGIGRRATIPTHAYNCEASDDDCERVLITWRDASEFEDG